MHWLLFWRPPCVRRRVIVNLKHNNTEAFEAVLWSYRWRWLTLRDVSALKGGQPPVKLPGDMVLHRDNVAFMQVLP